MKFPRIIRVEFKIRDDIWMARKKICLSLKEMNNKLFICGVEAKPGWEVDIVISHFLEQTRKEGRFGVKEQWKMKVVGDKVYMVWYL